MLTLNTCTLLRIYSTLNVGKRVRMRLSSSVQYIYACSHVCINCGVNLLHSRPFSCSATTSSEWPQWIRLPCTLSPVSAPSTPDVTPPNSEVTPPLSTAQPTTTTWCVPLWHPDAYPISCCVSIANGWLSLPLMTALYNFLSHYNYILSQYAQLMSVHNID